MNWPDAIAGLVLGFFGGALGLGSGLIGIPMITDVLHYPMAVARSSSLINNVVLSLSAGFRHKRHGSSLEGLGPLLTGSMAGLVLGSVMNSISSETFMWWIYATFLLCILAVFLWPKPETARGTGAEVFHPRRVLVTGVLASFFLGSLGVGGGALMVPFLNRWAGITLKRSMVLSTTSIIVSSLLAIPLGYEPGSGTLSLHMVPGLLLGGYAGSSVGQRMPDRWLRVIFSLILGLILVKVLSRLM
ncbi:MAG: sulfite exporter TauE/SafE family protein [Planctomycetota bacterium]